MKVLLFASFPEKFMQNVVLPKLRKRVENIDVLPPAKADHRVFETRERPDVVLHMTEYGGHSESEKLATICRARGLTIRSLSRKESSWSFLPPAKEESEVETSKPKAFEAAKVMDLDDVALVTTLEAQAIGRDLKAAREHASLSQLDLANANGSSQGTVSRYERGIGKAEPEYLSRVLKACGLPSGWRGLGPKETTMVNGNEVHAPLVSPPATTPSLPEPKAIPMAETTDRRVVIAAQANEIQELRREVEGYRKQGRVLDAYRVLHEEGLLSTEELLAKLFPKRG